jgi:pyruvate formate lyase activating enzyme
MTTSGEEIKGYVHSIETMGTLDGPGTRCIVFMQGCPLRCNYCHNPDTWQMRTNDLYSVNELFSKVARYKSYFGKKGGVTVSGGEPLAQAEFVNEFFALCRQEKIHTVLDTAGFELNDSVMKVLENSDLVLLDIKHTDPAKYHLLTGGNLTIVLDFLDYITSKNIDFWVRQVIVPGNNDTETDILALSKLLQGRPSLKRIELLAFHQMAIDKWHKLGLDYHLKEIAPPDEKIMTCLREVLVKQGLPIKIM